MLMTGTTIAQAIPLAISPILTRLYTPEDFGVFALFLSLVAVFTPIGSARYEQAILLSKNNEDAISVFALGFTILSAVCIVLLLCIVLFHTFIMGFLENSELEIWIYCVPVTVFFVGLFNLLNYLNNKKKYYNDMARASVLKSIVLAIVQVVVGFVQEGASGLISGQVFSQFFANIKLAKNIFSRKSFGTMFKKRELLQTAKEYSDFPRYQIPQVFLNTMTFNLPVFVFASFFSALVTGFYSFAIRVVLTPMMIISTSSAKVYNEKLVELIQKGEDAYRFTLSFLRALSLKVVIMLIVVVIFAPDIFSFIFGDDWEEVGVYTRLLAPWLFLNVIVSTVAYIPNVLKRQRKVLNMSAIHFVLTVIAVAAGVFFEDVYLLLVAFMLSNSVVLSYNLYWFLKELRSFQALR